MKVKTRLGGRAHRSISDPNGPKDNWPLQRDFDRFYGTIHGAGSYFDPSTLTRDNTAISPFTDPAHWPMHALPPTN